MPMPRNRGGWPTWRQAALVPGCCSAALFDPDKDIVRSEKPRRGLTALGCLLPALGVDGEDGQILIAPAPDALAGIDSASFGPARIRVHVTGPGREQAARLAADDRAPRLSSGGGGGSPPMLALAERGTAAARTLSYAALADYRRCGYRFLAERVLQIGREGEATVASPEGPSPPRPGGMGFGRAVHELLEWSARSSWRSPPEAIVAATLRREGFEPGVDASAAELVDGWLGSDLLAGLRDAEATFRPEVPFRIQLGAGTVIRGTIDLLVIRPGEPPMFVDYKTDSISAAGPVLPPAYELQRFLYAAAIAESTGGDRVASAYCFLQAPARTRRRDARAGGDRRRPGRGRGARRPDPRGGLRARPRSPAPPSATTARPGLASVPTPPSSRSEPARERGGLRLRVARLGGERRRDARQATPWNRGPPSCAAGADRSRSRVTTGAARRRSPASTTARSRS